MSHTRKMYIYSIFSFLNHEDINVQCCEWAHVTCNQQPVTMYYNSHILMPRLPEDFRFMN